MTVVSTTAVRNDVRLALIQLGANGQLEPSLWTVFLTPDPWVDYLIPGLVGTLRAAAAPGADSHAPKAMPSCAIITTAISRPSGR